MERLTKKELINGHVICEHKESECNDSCMYGRCEWNKKALLRLKEYEDAEENGNLINLPFKLGGTLYDIFEFVEKYKYHEIYAINASKVEISRDEKGILYCIDSCDYREKEFGTTLFESMEEARAAIEKLRNEV